LGRASAAGSCRCRARGAVPRGRGSGLLERVAAAGVRKKLVGVRLGGAPLTVWLEDFWPVTSGGREVGRLTSAAYSPRLRINMGYAWLPVELTAHGATVLAMSPDGPLDADVVPLPFWDPGKELPKA